MSMASVAKRRWLGGLIAVGLAAAVTVAVPGVSFAAPADLSGRYVAIGDSYTSAPGVLPIKDVSCFRSAQNYPTLVARDLRSSEAVDASCGGAETKDVFATQFIGIFPVNTPQIDRVTRETRLITISLGGNDIGFGNFMFTCLGAALNLLGPSCEQTYKAGGRDELRRRVDETAPKIANVLNQVKQRGPNAKVVLVGYPTILPASRTSCFFSAQLRDSDAYYLNRVFTSMNQMLAEEAEKADVQFVDTAQDSVGHDMCQPVGTRWFQPFLPYPPGDGVFYHPNAAGQAFVASRIVNDLRNQSDRD